MNIKISHISILLLVLSYFISYAEIIDSFKAYKLTEEYIEQNKWEEATATFSYLKQITEINKQNDKSKKLNELEIQLDKIVNHNLKLLYDKGQNQLENYQFQEAIITFSKILYYQPEYRNIKKLLEKTLLLNDISNGTIQKKDIVTSKTPDRRQTGLRVYKPSKFFNGYTLFAYQSLKEVDTNRIYLIDMNGSIIHQWITENNIIFARLKPNGNIVYIGGNKIQELDMKGNTVWHYYARRIDHSFQIIDNDKFLIQRDDYTDVPSEYKKYTIPSGYPRIEIINTNKEILWKWEGEKHIEELEKIIKINILPIGDWDNNNACEILKDNPLSKLDTRFKKGNIIFSYSTISTIGIIDYTNGKIVWTWGFGIIDGQHTPTMLDNGNILIFDNGRRRNWSRIIELNPLTKKIVWEYRADPKENFYSDYMGSATKLPNKNILISEGLKNRIFEITPDGEIVWDYIPTFNKISGCSAIYRAYRYSPEYVKPLLDKIEEWHKEQR